MVAVLSKRLLKWIIKKYREINDDDGLGDERVCMDRTMRRCHKILSQLCDLPIPSDLIWSLSPTFSA